jgi:tetratricopeptide (TPR) repeat protein
MRHLLALGLGFALASHAWAAPGKSAPQDDPKKAAAKQFYEAGMLLYDRGEFLDAAKEFERAFGESPLPDLLYNIGQAYDKGGERKKAVEAYRKYAAASPGAKDVAFATKRADVLEREQKELDAAKAATTARPAEPARKLPPPLPFVEPVTKYTFQTWVMVDGKPYTLLGAGARKVFGFKVYAMGLYVEDEPARAAFPKLAATAGGSDHDTLVRGDLVNRWLVDGEFGKMAVLHFVRNVSGKDTRDSYREALGEDAGPRASGETKQAVDQFLALFDDIKDGENLTIRTTPDGQVTVEQGGKKKVGPKNIRISHDIWDIWMGAKPINTDLKAKLVDRVDTLGR